MPAPIHPARRLGNEFQRKRQLVTDAMLELMQPRPILESGPTNTGGGGSVTGDGQEINSSNSTPAALLMFPSTGELPPPVNLSAWDDYEAAASSNPSGAPCAVSQCFLVCVCARGCAGQVAECPACHSGSLLLLRMLCNRADRSHPPAPLPSYCFFPCPDSFRPTASCALPFVHATTASCL